MLKTPINREKIKYHFSYAWWKYVLLTACVLFFINLLLTTTAYRPPREKRVDLFVSASADQQLLQAYLDKAREAVLPDMEQMNAHTMLPNDGTDIYAAQQLMVYIMTGEGNVYLLSRTDFANYASQGALVNLDPYIESGALNVQGLDLSKTKATYHEEEGDAGQTHVYGISTDTLGGLAEFYINHKDMVLCVIIAAGNEDNSVKLLNYMLETLVVE